MHDLLERRWVVDERFELPAPNHGVVSGEVQHDTVDVTKVYYDTGAGAATATNTTG